MYITANETVIANLFSNQSFKSVLATHTLHNQNKSRPSDPDSGVANYFQGYWNIFSSLSEIQTLLENNFNLNFKDLYVNIYSVYSAEMQT